MISPPYTYLRRLLAAILMLSSFPAHSATLAELYDSVPQPPPDVATALSWVKDGKIVQAEYVAIAEALSDERAILATLNGGEMPEEREPAPKNIADGTPVQEAARSYSDYLLQNQGKNEPKAVLSKRKRWLQAAYGKKQMDIAKKMTPCPRPCTDASILSTNEPLLHERDVQLDSEISAWNILFADWKKTRSNNVIAADIHMTATDDGKAATTAQGRSLIANYKAAMLNEIELLLSITKLCVLRADAIVRGLDGSESDAITGATKKAG